MTTSGPSRTARIRNPDATRAAILAAATDVMHEGGEAAVRVSDVAARAGVTTGAIYSHFGSRDMLIASAEVDYLRRQAAKFGMAYTGVNDDDIEAAALGGPSYMDFVEWLMSPPGRKARLAWVSASANALTDVSLRDMLAPLEFGVLDQAAKQIAHMQAAGLVAPELDPRAVAVLRVGAGIGAAVAERPFMDDPEFRAELLRAWPNVARAFAPRPEPDADTQESDA